MATLDAAVRFGVNTGSTVPFQGMQDDGRVLVDAVGSQAILDSDLARQEEARSRLNTRICAGCAVTFVAGALVVYFFFMHYCAMPGWCNLESTYPSR